MLFIFVWRGDKGLFISPMTWSTAWKQPSQIGKSFRDYWWRWRVATSRLSKLSGRGNEDVLGGLNRLLEVYFSHISKPIRNNLAVLALSFLQVLSAVRSGYGRLSLAALARALPTPGTAHAREKRLHRFLRNPRLDFRVVSDGLAPLLLPARQRFCPILLDQTQSGSTQALVAAVPYGGRALPLGCYTFDYPLTEPALKSQNELEHIFLLDLESSFPPGVIPVWSGDRGYARSLLLEQNETERRVFVIRGRPGTVVTDQGHRQKLGELRVSANQAIRYSHIRYHAQREVPVDIIAYWDPGYEEPWYLLVPAGSEGWLKTEEVVLLYRERMQIEQSFRDFKTHLGLRGLDLQVEIAARMGRLLLAFCLVYILCVLLGDSRRPAECSKSLGAMPATEQLER